MNRSSSFLSTPCSRRDFLSTAALAGAASVLAPTLATAAEAAAPTDSGKGLVGSNIYGWTQYAQRDKKPLDVDEVISALRDCGYHYLESFLDVNRPEEAGRFAEKLKSKGLQPVSMYVGGQMHQAAEAKTTVQKILAAGKVCRDAGFKVLSCNPAPIGREKTEEELKTQVSALADLGEGCHELGLKLGIHHHMPEMANNAREFHYVFRHTKPDRVGFCYDVHWVWKGGVMPQDALKEYGNRVVTWHIRQSKDQVWTEILEPGDVDYEMVARYAKEHQLPRRFTVELALEGGTKVTRSVVENHRLSREYVRKVFGA